MKKTYTVPQENYGKLRDRVAELNRRAEKLGCPPIEMTVQDEKFVKHPDGGEYLAVTVQVEGEAPMLEGWELIAVLEPNGEDFVIRRFPWAQGNDEAPIPEEFWNADTERCDHCNTRRFRKSVYIVRHEDGRWAQVGSTCLADFTGSNSPHAAAKWAEALENLDKEARDYDGIPEVAPYTRLRSFCACVSAEIRRGGWVSKSKAQELDRPSTAYLASVLMSSTTAGAAPQDFDTADKAIEYIRSLEDDGTEFIHNLKAVYETDLIEWKLEGFAAYGVQHYLKSVTPKWTPGFVGKVGEKTELTLVLVGERDTPGYMGGTNTMYTFRSPEGHKVVWFYAGYAMDGLEVGQTYRGKATIKKHDSRYGSTTITRFKPVAVEA